MSRTNNKRGHHITPEYYLKGFTNSSGSNDICVFQKGKEPFCANVEVVGKQNDFYTLTQPDGIKDSNTVENELELIERPANKLVRKIRTNQMPDLKERKILAGYISAMLLRVPKNRERITGLFPGVLDALEVNLRRMGTDTISVEPLVEIVNQYRTTGVPDWLQVRLDWEKYAPVFNDMTWVFFTSTSRGFLTSDNPVFFFEGMGLLGGDLPKDLPEVCFPISKKVALWATWRGGPEGFVQANERIVMEINRRVVSAASRFVYYDTTARWVSALVNKDSNRIRLNRILLT